MKSSRTGGEVPTTLAEPGAKGRARDGADESIRPVHERLPRPGNASFGANCGEQLRGNCVYSQGELRGVWGAIG